MRKSKNDSPEARKSPRSMDRSVDRRSFLKSAPQAKDIPLLNR
jgi:hypothetical protein